MQLVASHHLPGHLHLFQLSNHMAEGIVDHISLLLIFELEARYLRTAIEAGRQGATLSNYSVSH